MSRTLEDLLAESDDSDDERGVINIGIESIAESNGIESESRARSDGEWRLF